jgi:hypothetical protein
VTISRGLRRLFELRQIEELQKAALLEAATAELHRLENALEVARTREGNGRALVSRSVMVGEMQDRIFGVEEIATAVRISTVLRSRVHSATEKIQRIRNDFLNKRLDRRQVETLLGSALQREANQAERKMQLALDEWSRLRRREDTVDRDESSAHSANFPISTEQRGKNE